MSDRVDVLVPSGATPSKVRPASRDPDPLKGGDVYKWAQEQAALIRAGRYREIDWINVADEIDSVGKSELRNLRSALQVIVVHMLKWDHQPAKRSRSWINSIDEMRDHVAENLSENPSLKAHITHPIDVAYRLGRRAAARQTELDVDNFPLACPYDWDALTTRAHILDRHNESS